MNNLENLLANNKPALVKILGNMDGVDCRWDCLAQPLCIHDADTRQHGCAAVRATWLLQEYVKPDSWEQIEADAKQDASEYWRCSEIPCDECPSRLDGKKPRAYYGVGGCDEAMACDLVARCKQLALDGVAQDGR